MDSLATKVERHLLTLGGATWDILQTGGAGDMIFLFHGNSSSYLTYSKLLASPLADKYHLVAVNLPWHGLSRPPKVDLLSIPSMASMVLELIAYFSPKRFMLVGHSVGGHILGHLADRVSNCGGIVLISAPPISLPSLAAAFKADPTGGAIFTPYLDDAQIQLLAENLLGPAYSDQESRDALESSIRSTNGVFRQQLGESILAGQRSDEGAVIANSDVPAAFVWVQQDHFLQESYCQAVAFKRSLGQGNYCFDQSGHSPHLAQPEDFIQLLDGLANVAGLS